MIVIDVLVVAYDKKWKNQVILYLHGQVVLDIFCLNVDQGPNFLPQLINFEHSQSTSLPNIQHFLIMTERITLQPFTKALHLLFP